MGSFYTSHTVRGPSQQQVLDWLDGRPAFVSATDNGNTTVLDEACESQDPHLLADLGIAISAHFACPVLAVLNHDDDVLYVALYDQGHISDEYNSCPGMFDDDGSDGMSDPEGGDAARLAAAFGGDAAAVEAALRQTGFVMATQRHQALAAALGLPASGVGIGYHYAQAGDWPAPAGGDTFLHSGEH